MIHEIPLKEKQFSPSKLLNANHLEFNERRKHKRVFMDDLNIIKSIQILNPQMKFTMQGQIINQSQSGLLCVFKKIVLLKNQMIETSHGHFKIVWTNKYNISDHQYLKAGLELLSHY